MPKLLAFQEARDLYDYEMIGVDLRFAKSCFDAISEREYGVNVPLSFDRNDVHHVDWCVFVTGALCYRRCFKSGVRNRLSDSELSGRVSDDLLELHTKLIAIVDKHLAHSVNEMETGCSNVQIAVDSKNRLHRGGIGWSGSGVGPFGPVGYRNISILIEEIVQTALKDRLEALKQSVSVTVSQMTDEQILALPDGFAAHIKQPRFDKRRRWPTQ